LLSADELGRKRDIPRAMQNIFAETKSSCPHFFVCDFSATDGIFLNFRWSSFYCLRNFPLLRKFGFKNLVAESFE
jgi:hypothetical protein